MGCRVSVASPHRTHRRKEDNESCPIYIRNRGSGSFLHIGDVPRPQLEYGHVLLRVVACGICRTDLHIVEGDLPPLQPQLIPGDRIVGAVVEGATAELPLGTRVGVSWMGGTEGDCWYCNHGMENL